MHIVPLLFLVLSTPPHRQLLSFPTRRSSDLPAIAEGRTAMKGSVRLLAAAGVALGALAFTATATAGYTTPRLEIRNPSRSEEYTSELQSPCNLVCRLLLEKKKDKLSRDATRL